MLTYTDRERPSQIGGRTSLWRPVWFSMQIELFACHYANKNNDASHRGNAAVVNEPPHSAIGGPSRKVRRESRHFFAFVPVVDFIRDRWLTRRAVKVAPSARISSSYVSAACVRVRARPFITRTMRTDRKKKMLNSWRTRGKALDLSHD